ncbi:MAG TPA: DUF3881 family protein [Pyrinomonadaceae bacterium]|jgi:hypothetical protein|nr:DUF3881 family protein [Pyrinomonadaceae bacterium]
MNPTFETIGLEVSSEKAFNYLAERAGDQGEPTQLNRRGAVLHGRCWKLGGGLEVWTVLYESGSGDLFYADCRPGFRARYIQTISPWALTEYDEEGEAVIHGFREGTDCEVLFELQNLTEVGSASFSAPELHVGLCGLAYRARVRSGKPAKARWVPLEKAAPARAAHENDWSLSGQVIAYKPLKNPLSGGELFWIHVDLERIKLEVLVNKRALRGSPLSVGATLEAEVWLQGHVLDEHALRSRYEGVDYSCSQASYWSTLKRKN